MTPNEPARTPIDDTPSAAWLIERLQRIADADSSRDADHLTAELMAIGIEGGWLTMEER